MVRWISDSTITVLALKWEESDLPDCGRVDIHSRTADLVLLFQLTL